MGADVNKTKERAKTLAEIRRVEEAIQKSGSEFLKRDYRKYLKRLRKSLSGLAVILAILMSVLPMGAARADEPEQMWVLCNPESYVVIRETPSRNGTLGGYLYMGDAVWTDGATKGKWIHLVDLSTEQGDGWVSKGYLDYSEPQLINMPAKILKSQTRARGCIDGEVKRRLKKGTMVTVYAENLKWSVTSVGYIKTDLLEVQRE